MKKRPVPIHETGYICASLAMVSGFLETYTYLLKGGVFANAQTGNFALLGMAIDAEKRRPILSRKVNVR